MVHVLHDPALGRCVEMSQVEESFFSTAWTPEVDGRMKLVCYFANKKFKVSAPLKVFTSVFLCVAHVTAKILTVCEIFFMWCCDIQYLNMLLSIQTCFSLMTGELHGVCSGEPRLRAPSHSRVIF